MSWLMFVPPVTGAICNTQHSCQRGAARALSCAACRLLFLGARVLEVWMLGIADHQKGGKPLKSRSVNYLAVWTMRDGSAPGFPQNLCPNHVDFYIQQFLSAVLGWGKCRCGSGEREGRGLGRWVQEDFGGLVHLACHTEERMTLIKVSD